MSVLVEAPAGLLSRLDPPELNLNCLLSVSHQHRPGLSTAVVSIGQLRLLSTADLTCLVEHALTGRECDQYRTLLTARRRYEWLAGRLAAKHAAAAYLRQNSSGCRPSTAASDPFPISRPEPTTNWCFVVGSGREMRLEAGVARIEVDRVAEGIFRGRPVVDRPVEISVSHSNDFAIAVSAAAPVGVDLERCRQLAPELLAALRLDPIETAGDGMPLHLRWSCKEAVLKCVGVGLRLDSRQVVLTGWHESGWFDWQRGPELAAEFPNLAPIRGWAGERAGYSLAIALAAS